MIKQMEKELIMSDEHLAVYQIILNSESKYVTRSSILAQLGKDSTYNRRLSQILNDLVVKYKKPVGASSKQGTQGCFIIENDTDKYIAIRELQSKSESLYERYMAIKNLDISEGDHHEH